jgi:hypothetical protein
VGGISLEAKCFEHICDQGQFPKIAWSRPFVSNERLVLFGLLDEPDFVSEEGGKVTKVKLMFFQTSAFGVIDSIPWASGRTRQGEPNENTPVTRSSLQCLECILEAYNDTKVILDGYPGVVPSQVFAVVAYSTGVGCAHFDDVVLRTEVLLCFGGRKCWCRSATGAC